jgi:hypothetical protein
MPSGSGLWRTWQWRSSSRKARCDRQKAEVSHLHSNRQHLMAQTVYLIDPGDSQFSSASSNRDRKSDTPSGLRRSSPQSANLCPPAITVSAVHRRHGRCLMLLWPSVSRPSESSRADIRRATHPRHAGPRRHPGRPETGGAADAPSGHPGCSPAQTLEHHLAGQAGHCQS